MSEHATGSAPCERCESITGRETYHDPRVRHCATPRATPSLEAPARSTPNTVRALASSGYVHAGTVDPAEGFHTLCGRTVYTFRMRPDNEPLTCAGCMRIESPGGYCSRSEACVRGAEHIDHCANAAGERIVFLDETALEDLGRTLEVLAHVEAAHRPNAPEVAHAVTTALTLRDGSKLVPWNVLDRDQFHTLAASFSARVRQLAEARS